MADSVNGFTSEVELAKHFVAWLVDQHWEVYQEVQPDPYGPVADIVAIRHPVVWVLECKLSPGFRVIEQAYYWLPRAHMVSVAVPWISSRRHRSNSFETAVMKQFGIGKLEIQHGSTVRELIQPAFSRRANVAWVKKLTPQQKSFASAGNNANRRWTPFVETRQQVIAYVQAHPGCSLAQLLANVKTHYRSSSARHLIPRYIENGIIRDVRLKRDGKQLLLYPVDISDQK